MSKNMKLLTFITLGLFTLIYIGSKNEAFQPTITKLIVSISCEAGKTNTSKSSNLYVLYGFK